MDLEFWANVSAVWLAFLCFIGMLVPLGMAFFAVKGMHAAVSRVPGWLGKAQEVSHTVRTKTAQLSEQVTEPIIATERKATRFSRFVRRLTSGR